MASSAPHELLTACSRMPQDVSERPDYPHELLEKAMRRA